MRETNTWTETETETKTKMITSAKIKRMQISADDSCT